MGEEGKVGRESGISALRERARAQTRHEIEGWAPAVLVVLGQRHPPTPTEHGTLTVEDY